VIGSTSTRLRAGGPGRLPTSYSVTLMPLSSLRSESG
jgi:hypothetical protein